MPPREVMMTDGEGNFWQQAIPEGDLLVTREEAAFLLVLLCEQQTIESRMKELNYPMPNIDDLIARVRRLSWQLTQAAKALG